ncbi:hypothetical protein CWB96_18975 [Pseudoalteromonas citrea]|uniref:Uncharacterized protein n=1 Tax=Pseudoalteromonas citrea TaxID=43655 RepID=A0A5S3XLK3_9GAMM|nr:hypothetical protein CWB97_08235 [Pseudoalteromonas citrea]TMP54591.1 hypothetical protein CWB96_18975 [Pseudoalteromonas citrea]
MKLEKIKQSLIVKGNWAILLKLNKQGEKLCQSKVNMHICLVVTVMARMTQIQKNSYNRRLHVL